MPTTPMQPLCYPPTHAPTMGPAAPPMPPPAYGTMPAATYQHLATPQYAYAAPYAPPMAMMPPPPPPQQHPQNAYMMGYTQQYSQPMMYAPTAGQTPPGYAPLPFATAVPAFTAATPHWYTPPAAPPAAVAPPAAAAHHASFARGGSATAPQGSHGVATSANSGLESLAAVAASAEASSISLNSYLYPTPPRSDGG